MSTSTSQRSKPKTASSPPAGQKKSGAASQAKAAPETPDSEAEADTDVEDDQIYALSSVLHNALEAASAARKYIRDARAGGDDELAEFFQECREDYAAHAEKAKQLLVARVDSDADADSDEDGEDDEE